MDIKLDKNKEWYIKLLPQKKFAESLIKDGELAISPIYRFKKLDEVSGRKDLDEGRVLENDEVNNIFYLNRKEHKWEKLEKKGIIDYSTGTNNLIYCMYTIMKKQIHKDKLDIDIKRLHDEFTEGNGIYAVFIEKKEFDKKITDYAIKNNIKIKIKPVYYYDSLKQINIDDRKNSVVKKDMKNLFYKSIKYEYQQETRVLFQKKLENEEKGYDKIFIGKLKTAFIKKFEF